MTFSNGYTASVRWGNEFLYCNKIPCEHTLGSAENVEVAVSHPKGHFHKLTPWIPDHDDVAGYVKIDKVPEFLNAVKEIKD